MSKATTRTVTVKAVLKALTSCLLLNRLVVVWVPRERDGAWYLLLPPVVAEDLGLSPASGGLKTNPAGYVSEEPREPGE